jgi:hypothetical protein
MGQEIAVTPLQLVTAQPHELRAEVLQRMHVALALRLAGRRRLIAVGVEWFARHRRL